jgi:hypothetical protein
VDSSPNLKVADRGDTPTLECDMRRSTRQKAQHSARFCRAPGIFFLSETGEKWAKETCLKLRRKLLQVHPFFSGIALWFLLLHFLCGKKPADILDVT